MITVGEGLAVPKLPDADELDRVAALLDEACAETTRYKRFARAQDLLLGGRVFPDLEDLDDELVMDDVVGLAAPASDAPQSEQTAPMSGAEVAAWAAMRFEPDIVVVDGRERVSMIPHFRGPDSTDPVKVEATASEVVQVWSELSGRVESPAAKARLHHLLFQRGGAVRHQRALDGIDAYMAVAGGDSRTGDRVEAARVAVRLARSVKDMSLTEVAVAALGDVVGDSIDGDQASVGAARSGLGTLMREDAPQAVDLVNRACARWSVDSVGGPFWEMKLRLTPEGHERARVWRDVVEQHIAAAEVATSNILRASRLRDALAAAESSGDPDLRDRAAVLIQDVRHRDLEMMHISASSYQFEEVLERAVAEVVGEDPDAGPSTAVEGAEEDSPWYPRLVWFTRFRAPTGDPDDSRAQVASQHAASPLGRFFPTQLTTPEGLPLFTAGTEEDRFELDMVKWETTLLSQWAPIMGEALKRVAQPVVPPEEKLAHALSEGAASDEAVGRQLADGFARFWTGDTVGSLYTVVPMIEALVRNAVINADRGVFRLQKNHSPGQYVGLGVLLGHFKDAYSLDERDVRFFNALLVHPAGWNLRNLLAHGYLPGDGGSAAAVALYAAMRVIVIAGNGPGAGDVSATDESA